MEKNDGWFAQIFVVVIVGDVVKVELLLPLGFVCFL